MHTTIPNSSPTLADLKQTMIRIQIAALETLERCMQNLEPTGDDKKDRAQAQQLNRQRLSATQTLLHCRTMFRELREAELQEHRIAEEKKQSEKKAIFDLANLRHLHRIYPNQYDNPDAPGGIAMQSMAMQDAEPTPSAEGIAKLRVAMPPSPSAGATGGSPASAGPSEPQPHPDNEITSPPPPQSIAGLIRYEQLKRQRDEMLAKRSAQQTPPSEP